MESIVNILFDRFRKIPERFWKPDPARCWRYLDTKRFVARRYFPVIEMLDSFGTTKLRYKNQTFNLLNDFGDQEIVDDIERIPDGYRCVFTPCIITEQFNVEVADFVYSPYYGLFLTNHKSTTIPKSLHRFGIDIYRGKRAFYYDHLLSLRITADASLNDELGFDAEADRIFEQIPKIYRHVEADKWICSPRVKLSLRQCR